MLTFTLVISCLTTSSLPWFMDLNISGSYAILLFPALDLASITSHIHKPGVVFALAPSLHSFWSYFSIDLQYHIGHLPAWGVHLSVSYLFAFSYCSWGSQSKNNEVVCHSLLQLAAFCQISPPWPVCLGWPHTAWPSFIELAKDVVHVIRLASFLWLWFQSVCPLMPFLSAYHLTCVTTSTLDMGCVFLDAPAKRNRCSLPWTWGISFLPTLLLHYPTIASHSCAAAAVCHSAAVPSLSTYPLTWVSLTLDLWFLLFAARGSCSAQLTLLLLLSHFSCARFCATP